MGRDFHYGEEFLIHIAMTGRARCHIIQELPDISCAHDSKGQCSLFTSWLAQVIFLTRKPQKAIAGRKHASITATPATI
jgi:hypothetical protein